MPEEEIKIKSFDSAQDMSPDSAQDTQTEVVVPQEPVVVPVQEPVVEPDVVPVQEPVPQINTLADRMKNMLAKSIFAMQTRKRKKLDRIMNLFGKQIEITNNEVEKLLHVSDATATRYLEILQKENKIIQIGVKGRRVYYKKV